MKCKAEVSDGKLLRENLLGKGEILMTGQSDEITPGEWQRMRNLVRHGGRLNMKDGELSLTICRILELDNVNTEAQKSGPSWQENSEESHQSLVKERIFVTFFPLLLLSSFSSFLPTKRVLSAYHVSSALLGMENAKMGKNVFCPLWSSWSRKRERQT